MEITKEQKQCFDESMEALEHFLSTKDRGKFKKWTRKWESKIEEWKKQDPSFSIPASFELQ